MLLVGEVTPGNSFLWHGRVVGEVELEGGFARVQECRSSSEPEQCM
jgi:hypothetical protein